MNDRISKLVASFHDPKFVRDLAERVVAGAVIGAAAALSAGTPFGVAVAIAALSGAGSVLKGILATQVGASDSASLVG